MLRYFHRTEITDWMPAPRSLKILNGLTLHLPPEICLRTFGTEIQDHCLFGDLTFQIRSCLFGLPILRGVAPTVEEIGEPRRGAIAHALDLYKRVIRPLLPTARVFHHTPILPLMEPQPWCVLEYAAPDGSCVIAGIFRLTGPCDGIFRFQPRGLRAEGRYRVTDGNTDGTVERHGFELQRDGIEVRLECALTSELLIFNRI
jgi:alpha-galactosidase